MALWEGQYLIVQQGQNKHCLLLRNGSQFHIVSVDRRLTKEVEEKLLAMYPCSDQSLSELGITYEKISPRGVAVTGTHAGETVILYVGKKKRKFILSDDYNENTMNAFFAGILQFTPPQHTKRRKSDQDWRRENRNPELYHKLRFVTVFLSVLVTIFSVGYLIHQTWIWYLGCLLCLMVPVVLDIVFPAYVTLMWPVKGEKTDALELGWVYFIHLLALMLFPAHNWLNEKITYLSWGVVGGIAALVLGLFAEEFRRNKTNLIVVFLFVGILGTFVVGHVNEVFDFSEHNTYLLTVEDLQDTRSRRNSHYACTVTLPDGRQVELDISREFYMTLETGDRVLVEHSVGALGIEYANAFPLE